MLTQISFIYNRNHFIRIYLLWLSEHLLIFHTLWAAQTPYNKTACPWIVGEPREKSYDRRTRKLQTLKAEVGFKPPALKVCGYRATSRTTSQPLIRLLFLMLLKSCQASVVHMMRYIKDTRCCGQEVLGYAQ